MRILAIFLLFSVAATAQNNALLIGRSTGWEPTDVANLTLWLRADQEVYQDAGKVTPTSATNDPIALWGDLSGNGNDFTSVGDSDPIYRILDSFNGHPSIYFFGSALDNEGLEGPSSLFPATGDFTAYVVCRSLPGLSSGNRVFFGQYQDISAGRMHFGMNAAIQDNINFFIDATPTSVLNWFSRPLNLVTIYTVVRDGNNWDFYENGALVVSSTVSSVSITTAVNTTIGYGFASANMGYFVNGQVAEAGLWSAALSSADLDDLHEYLTIRYFNY